MTRAGPAPHRRRHPTPHDSPTDHPTCQSQLTMMENGLTLRLSTTYDDHRVGGDLNTAMQPLGPSSSVSTTRAPLSQTPQPGKEWEMLRIRTLSAGVLCALGLSFAGVLVGPAIASAAPGNLGPIHPGGGQIHPGASLVHPGEGPLRPGEGPLRPGEGPLRPGEGPWRLGEGPWREGEGPWLEGEGQWRELSPQNHPIYHYGNDVTHPVWSAAHPVWALAP
ncbi:conserved hypothetical protein [Mycobacterium ulcerans Agy99]|uniref:Uncharacterized protein n=2 Tax=Mycobacterium ulcerans TaxID=1809 RepID=A0PMK1_MYCUA|nr:conserved hypothetical protein [Mycobacterium ulcerans Agy99]